MSVFDEKALRAHLKENELLRCYLLLGDEPYLKGLYLSKLTEKAGSDGLASFNTDYFDGKSCDLRDVFERAAVMPMMSDKRLIVVDDRKLDPIGAHDLDLLSEGLSSLPESAVVIFRQDVFPVSKKTGKKVRDLFSQYGAVCELDKRSGSELYHPLIASAKKQNCILSPAMAQYLVASVGDELNVLSSELAKVCAYAKQGEITKQHIDAVATKTLDAKVYALARALLQNNFESAYGVLHTLLQMHTEPLYILGALSGAFIDLYRAKVAVANAGDTRQLVSAFSYKGREFALQNAVRDGRKLELWQLRQCLQALQQADLRLKSSSDSGALVLEQLLVRLRLMMNGETT